MLKRNSLARDKKKTLKKLNISKQTDSLCCLLFGEQWQVLKKESQSPPGLPSGPFLPLPRENLPPSLLGRRVSDFLH